MHYELKKPEVFPVRIKFCPLFSGSSGNSVFISYGDTKILVDCGFTFKKIKESLSLIGEDIFNLDAVLITHSHSDHTAALPVLLKALKKIPVVGSRGTLTELYPKISEYMDRLYANAPNKKFGLKDLAVSSFAVPHDASETVGYNIYAGEKTVTLMTDIGHLEDSLYENAEGRDLVYLESNHDVNILENCSYPHYLKQRILSLKGHLSNENAGIFAADLIKKGTERIMLAHLSGEANTPDVAFNTVSGILENNGIKVGGDMRLSLAPRGELGEVVTI
jgi:phosphoribosyl 1,2-cyclic phosphodiesterase